MQPPKAEYRASEKEIKMKKIKIVVDKGIEINEEYVKKIFSRTTDKIEFVYQELKSSQFWFFSKEMFEKVPAVIFIKKGKEMDLFSYIGGPFGVKYPLPVGVVGDFGGYGLGTIYVGGKAYVVCDKTPEEILDTMRNKWWWEEFISLLK